MSERIRKVNELIREEVSQAISRHISSTSLLTVKAVETERDLKKAIVWVSILGDESQAFNSLKEASREIEHEVRSKMYAKYTPKLEFRVDHSEQYVEKIDKLLKNEQV